MNRPGDSHPQPAFERLMLEAVVANIGIGVVVCDCEGQIILANNAAVRTLDTQSDLALTSSVFDLIPLPQKTEIRAAFRHLARTKCDDSAFHEISFGISGRTIKCATYPIFANDETMSEAVLVLQDITRETEIAQAKTDFTYTVAHELRTPLTSLKGSIDLVLGNATGEVNDRARSLLAIAQTSCDRLIRLLDDMLDVAQAEAGSLKLRMHITSVDGCVLRAVEAFRHQAEARNIKLTVSMTGDIPVIVADQDRIEQVVVNILSNATKFSPPGSKVAVKLGRNRGFVQIKIMDEGPGVPDRDRERIFDKFYRRQDIEAADRSTGLGLAISKAIVDQHGGRISVRKRRQRGSTFVVDLPIPGEDELPRSTAQ